MKRGAELHNKLRVPEAGLAGTVASDMPTLTNKGGALEAPSGGETVVRDPGSDVTRKGTDQQGMPSVKQGTRDRVIEAQYGTADATYLQAAQQHGAGGAGAQGHDGHVAAGQVKPAAKGGRAVGAGVALEPAGALDAPAHTQAAASGGAYAYEGSDPTAVEEEGEAPAEEEEEGLEQEEQEMARAMEHISIDTDKVGMLHRPKDARDYYPRADDRHHEPLSDHKHQNEGATDVCVICECSPCVCDKAEHSYRDPLEMTAPQTKRTGKPHLHNVKKPITGHNHHRAHDYQAHAKTRDETRVHGEARMTGWRHDDKEEHKGPVSRKPHSPDTVPGPEDTVDQVENRSAGGGPMAVPDDEPQGKKAHPHVSHYTGGRPLGAVEDLRLSSGHHTKPHVLG